MATCEYQADDYQQSHWMLVDYKDSPSGEPWMGVTDIRAKSRLLRRLEQLLGRLCIEVVCDRPAVVNGDTDNRMLGSRAAKITAVFQGEGLVQSTIKIRPNKM